jgi:hypothetical protein
MKKTSKPAKPRDESSDDDADDDEDDEELSSTASAASADADTSQFDPQDLSTWRDKYSLNKLGQHSFLLALAAILRANSCKPAKNAFVKLEAWYKGVCERAQEPGYMRPPSEKEETRGLELVWWVMAAAQEFATGQSAQEVMRKLRAKTAAPIDLFSRASKDVKENRSKTIGKRNQYGDDQPDDREKKSSKRRTTGSKSKSAKKPSSTSKSSRGGRGNGGNSGRASGGESSDASRKNGPGKQ